MDWTYFQCFLFYKSHTQVTWRLHRGQIDTELYEEMEAGDVSKSQWNQQHPQKQPGHHQKGISQQGGPQGMERTVTGRGKWPVPQPLPAPCKASGGTTAHLFGDTWFDFGAEQRIDESLMGNLVSHFCWSIGFLWAEHRAGAEAKGKERSSPASLCCQQDAGVLKRFRKQLHKMNKQSSCFTTNSLSGHLS